MKIGFQSPRRVDLALKVIPLIIATTVQAQDFRDVDGDTANGRTTLPIIWPVGSRCITFASIVLWSAFLACASTVNFCTGLLFTLGSFGVALRFVLVQDKKGDGRSYLWYNVSSI